MNWRRVGCVAAVAVLLAPLLVDLGRPPDRQLSARALIAGVHLYQRVGRPSMPRGLCRFRPTCSSYAEAVIRDHGALGGGRLAVRRLLRCGPWTPRGTVDPPPMKK